MGHGYILVQKVDLETLASRNCLAWKYWGWGWSGSYTLPTQRKPATGPSHLSPLPRERPVLWSHSCSREPRGIGLRLDLSKTHVHPESPSPFLVHAPHFLTVCPSGSTRSQTQVHWALCPGFCFWEAQQKMVFFGP